MFLLLTCSLDSVSVILTDSDLGMATQFYTWIALHSSGLKYFIPQVFLGTEVVIR